MPAPSRRRYGSTNPVRRSHPIYRKATARRTGQSVLRGLRASAVTEPVHLFKRSYLLANVSNSFKVTANETPVDFTFTFDKLPTITDFTALFDQYRILKVKYYVDYFANSSSHASTSGGVVNAQDIPRFYIVSDQDDNNALTTVQAALQYQSVKKYNCAKPFTHTFDPRVLVQTYRTLTTTGYAPAEKPIWIDFAQTDVPHMCGKGMIMCNGASTTPDDVAFEIRCEVTFECKGTH